MKKYFQQAGNRLQPYHLLHGVYLLIIITGIIYRLWK